MAKATFPVIDEGAPAVPGNSALAKGARQLIRSCARGLYRLTGHPGLRPRRLHRLAPGSEFARLSAHNIDLIAAHLGELSTKDRYLRFGMTLSDARLTTYAKGLNFERDTFVGFVRNGRLLGFCHLSAGYGGASSACELGISVVPGARRHGLASRLMRACLEEAARRGWTSLHLEYLACNTRMAALGRKFGAVGKTDHESVNARVTVPQLQPAASDVPGA